MGSGKHASKRKRASTQTKLLDIWSNTPTPPSHQAKIKKRRQQSGSMTFDPTCVIDLTEDQEFSKEHSRSLDDVLNILQASHDSKDAEELSPLIEKSGMVAHNTTSPPSKLRDFLLDDFCFVLASARDREHSVLAAFELRLIDAFLQLPFESKRLYARLYLRVKTEFRGSSLKESYSHLFCVDNATEALLRSGFLRNECERVDPDLRTLLCVLKAEELRDLFSRMKVLLNRSTFVQSRQILEIPQQVPASVSAAVRKMKRDEVVKALLRLGGEEPRESIHNPCLRDSLQQQHFHRDVDSGDDEDVMIIEDSPMIIGDKTPEETESSERGDRGVQPEIKNALVKAVVASVGACYTLHPVVRKVISRLRRLFFLVEPPDTKTQVLAGIGRKKFIRYAVHHSSVFPDRSSMLCWEAAMQLREYVSLVEDGAPRLPPPPRCMLGTPDSLTPREGEGKYSWTDAEKIVLQAALVARRALEVLLPIDNQTRLAAHHPGSFLRRFSAECVLCRVLSRAIPILEKYNRRMEEATEYLSLLLRSAACPSKRADWWNRLSLDFVAIQKPRLALDACERALQEEESVLPESARAPIETRALKLAKKLRKWKMPKGVRSAAVRTSVRKEARVVTTTAEVLCRGVGQALRMRACLRREKAIAVDSTVQGSQFGEQEGDHESVLFKSLPSQGITEACFGVKCGSESGGNAPRGTVEGSSPRGVCDRETNRGVGISGRGSGNGSYNREGRDVATGNVSNVKKEGDNSSGNYGDVRAGCGDGVECTGCCRDGSNDTEGSRKCSCGGGRIASNEDDTIGDSDVDVDDVSSSVCVTPCVKAGTGAGGPPVVEGISVESFALEYYAKPDSGGWSGVHCETGVFLNLFGILLMEEIFRDGVAGVFLTPYQDAPLDLAADAGVFYHSRRQTIDVRLAQIGSFSICDLEADLRRQWTTWCGFECRGVNWDSYSLDELVVYAISVGGKVLQAILLNIARNFRYWSRGMPDLLLYRRRKISDLEENTNRSNIDPMHASCQRNQHLEENTIVRINLKETTNLGSEANERIRNHERPRRGEEESGENPSERSLRAVAAADLAATNAENAAMTAKNAGSPVSPADIPRNVCNDLPGKLVRAGTPLEPCKGREPLEAGRLLEAGKGCGPLEAGKGCEASEGCEPLEAGKASKGCEASEGCGPLEAGTSNRADCSEVNAQASPLAASFELPLTNPVRTAGLLLQGGRVSYPRCSRRRVIVLDSLVEGDFASASTSTNSNTPTSTNTPTSCLRHAMIMSPGLSQPPVSASICMRGGHSRASVSGGFGDVSSDNGRVGGDSDGDGDGDGDGGIRSGGNGDGDVDGGSGKGCGVGVPDADYYSGGDGGCGGGSNDGCSRDGGSSDGIVHVPPPFPKVHCSSNQSTCFQPPAADMSTCGHLMTDDSAFASNNPGHDPAFAALLRKASEYTWEARFVEVKSENDRLSEIQRSWIDTLLCVGADVEVLRVLG
eukprot:Rmarinus@m.24170